MLEADADFLIGMLSQMLEETDIDVFAFWEDMAYHTAPLISPQLARKFMLPRSQGRGFRPKPGDALVCAG